MDNLNRPEAMATGTEPTLNDTVAQVFGIVTRRRWWILLTACGIAFGTIAALSFLPNRYTSEATVLVIQQQVPERYVTPTSTTDISQALQGMTQEVLARTKLLAIIDELNLYAKDKTRKAPEALIEQMRRDIEIQPLENNPERRSVNSFKISFISENPQRAQEVTSRLTSLFIQENVKTREHQATITTAFLQEQLDAAKQQLTEQEEQIRSYKMQHLGELPEQQQGNVQILASLSSQLGNTMATLSRAQEQRAYLQSLLTGYRNLAARGTALPGAGSANTASNPVDAAQNELRRLQAQRSTLLSVYTPDHPDVKKVDAEISKAAAVVSQLKATTARKTDDVQAKPARSEDSEEDAAIAQVKSQLEANRLEIENLTKYANQSKASIEQYQNRLNATPVREQQLAGMLRDYELRKLNYADLLSKQQQSQLAMSLEQHQEGQQFRLVDPPSLPSLPSSPKRVKISLGGAAAGVFLGFALAFLIDTIDGTFHTEKEMIQKVRVPLVVAVPLFLSAGEERWRGWRMGVEWFAGSILVLAMMVAEFYVYRRG